MKKVLLSVFIIIIMVDLKAQMEVGINVGYAKTPMLNLSVGYMVKCYLVEYDQRSTLSRKVGNWYGTYFGARAGKMFYTDKCDIIPMVGGYYHLVSSDTKRYNSWQPGGGVKCMWYTANNGNVATVISFDVMYIGQLQAGIGLTAVF